MSSSQLLRSNGTLLFASDARRQLAAGEPLRAIETCKRGLARHPDHAAGYVVLAAAYRSIGESGRARLVLRRGFERTGLARLRVLAEEIPASESAKKFEPAASAAAEARVVSATTASRPIEVAHVADERAAEQVAQVSEGASTAIPQIEQLSEPTDDDVAIDRDYDMVAGILDRVGEFMHAAVPDEVSPVGLDETGETRVVEQVEAVSVAAPAGPQSDIAAEPAPGLPPIEQVLPEASDVPPLDPLSAEETHSPLELVEERDDAANAVEQSHSEFENAIASADVRDDAALTVEQSHSELEIAIARDDVRVDDAASIVEESHSDLESIRGRADDRDEEAIAIEQANSELEVVNTSADDREDDAAITVEQAHSELEIVNEGRVDAAEQHTDEPAAKQAVERDDSPTTEAMRAGGASDHDADAALPTVASGVAPETPAERPVDRSHERIPWFPRRVPRPSERPQGSSLALHSGKSAHRLTSANLRLIPGLEYAPLRAEDQGRRMMIAPIMEEPLPDWEPRRRPITVTNAPPLPEYPTVVPDAMTAAAHAAPTASAPDVPDSVSVRARESDELTMPSPAGAPSMDVGVGQMRESRQPRHIGPTQPSEKSSVVEAQTSTAGPAEVETDTSAIDELARRLEGARIPPIGEAPTVQWHVFEPSIVSDTLADILVAQGAFGEAMKAFMTLARMRPSQLAYYEERIAEMKRRIVEAGNGDQ